MATCQDCGLEMRTADGCTVSKLIIGDRRVARTPIDAPIGPADRCGDCGARTGEFHHLGCDLERCPLCRWQLITCGCGRSVDKDDEVRVLLPVIDGGLQPPAS